MGRIGETTAVIKEHLLLEEVQLAIGEFCVSATGYGILGADLITGRLAFGPWLAGSVYGPVASKTGLYHWRQAREKLGYREPVSETDDEYL